MPIRELSSGATISYVDEGSGRPVVLLHGVAMSVAFFERNVSNLAHDHRVIALDFRGHGSSPYVDGGHTVAQYARDVRALIEDYELAYPLELFEIADVLGVIEAPIRFRGQSDPRHCGPYRRARVSSKA